MNFHLLMFIAAFVGIIMAQKDLEKHPNKENIKYCRFMQIALTCMLILSLYFPND